MWDFTIKLLIPLIQIFIVLYLTWNGFKLETKNIQIEIYSLKELLRMIFRGR